MHIFKKRYLTFAIFILSSVMVFFGCTKNVYEDMKLQLDSYSQTIVLSDNQADNTFDVVASVTGRPKDYNGAVTFTISNPTDSIEFVQSTTVSDGETTATYIAKNPGSAVVNVVTKEGALSKQVVINVVKAITGLTFASDQIPLSRGQEFTVSDYLNFAPYDTNQKNISLSVSLLPNSTELQTELDKVVINQGKIFIPTTSTINNFVLTATSTADNTITDSVEILVINSVTSDQINIVYDNNTPADNSDDIVLSKVGSDFVLELAKNTVELNTKRIYFTFNNDAQLSTEYTVVNQLFTQNVVQLDTITTQEDTFDVKAVGEGTVTITFVVKHTQYPAFTNLYKYITLKVNVVSYPKSIVLTNGTTTTPITSLDLYQNYSGANAYGTPVKVTINDNNTEMYGQKAIVSFSSAGHNVIVRDRYGIIINSGDKVATGSTIYVSHTYSTGDTLPTGLQLIFTSDVYSATYAVADLHFITDQININITDTNVKINKSLNGGLGMEYGFKEVELTGLGLNFDYTTLIVSIADTNLVGYVLTSDSLTFVGKGSLGTTTARISATNGTYVDVNIVVFEALNIETTMVKVVGNYVSADNGATVATIRETNSYSVRNSLALNISYVINGVTLSAVPGGITTYTSVYDLNGNTVTSDRFIVKLITNSQVATQNRAGESLVTVLIRGYNDQGEQNQELIFKFIINVEIPVSILTTNSNEVTIYDVNSLGSTQIVTYGNHTVVLNTEPTNASFGFADINWSILYKNNIYTAEPIYSESTTEVTYYFVFEGSSYLTLITNTQDFKQARVSVRLDGTTATNSPIYLIAVINQDYFNENGNQINTRQEARIRLDFKRPDKVSDIIFGNVKNNTITYDSRDLSYDGNSGLFLDDVNTVKTINFSVLPSTALTKDLAVAYSGDVITVSVNNITKVITVKANKKSTSTIYVDVYAVDSVYGVSQYTKYVQLAVEILDGSSEELAYRVSTAYDLYRINESLDSYYVLTNNINIAADSSYSNWTPIGLSYVTETQTQVVNEFNGSLNGGYTVGGQTYYYTISNMRITNDTTSFKYNYLGLFGIIGSSGVVKNVTLINYYISVTDNSNNAHDFVYVGALAGLNKGTLQNNIVNDGNNVVSSDFIVKINNINSTTPTLTLNSLTYGIRYAASNNNRLIAIGGMVGINQSIMQDNFVGSALINFSDSSDTKVYAGGLVGVNDTENAIISKTVDNNYNPVSGTYDVISVINISNNLSISNADTAIGGLAGANLATIQNQVVRTIVYKGYNNVGGLIGLNSGNFNSASLVVNNLSVPTIRGNESVGGLIGTNQDNSYYINNGYDFAVNASEKNGTQVLKNRIEFIDFAYATSLYNTAIMGENFVGGLIGTNNQVVANMSVGQGYNFNSLVAYNSVFGYFTGTRTILNYYTSYESNKSNNSYFRDIVLTNTSVPADDSERDMAGALFGRAINLYATANSFNANMVANGAVLGGVVGYVDSSDGLDPNAIVFIADTSVSGYLINYNVLLPVGVTSTSANFIGDATKVATTAGQTLEVYNQVSSTTSSYFNILRTYSTLKQNSTTYIPNFVGITPENVTYANTFYIGATVTINVAWTNRSVGADPLYHYAYFDLVVTESVLQNGITQQFTYTLSSEYNSSDPSTYTTSTADIVISSIFNNVVTLNNFAPASIGGSSVLFDATSGVTGYMTYGYDALLEDEYYLNDQNDERIIGSYVDATNVYNSFANSTLVYMIYSPSADTNNNGIGDNIDADLATALSGFLTGGKELLLSNLLSQMQVLTTDGTHTLFDFVWYVNQDLNHGYPVLLNANRYLATILVDSQNANLVSYSTIISLLSNWPPTDITVSTKADYDRVWENLAQTQVTLYYTQINSSYYLSSGYINFGNNSLYTTEKLSGLTSTLVADLKAQNTYLISDVFDIATIPAFVGSGAVNIKSNNSSILSVEILNGQTVLVVKGVGQATLTLSSNYNSTITKSVTINIVRKINEVGSVAGVDLGYNLVKNGTRTNLSQVDTFEIIKSNEQNVKSVIVEALQNNIYTFNSTETGQVNFSMPVNSNSGTRYYLLNKLSTATEGEYNYSIYFDTEQIITLKINDQNLTSYLITSGDFAGKYVVYYDVTYGTNAVFSNTSIGLQNLFAVPYINNNNGDRIVLLDQSKITELSGNGIVATSVDDYYGLIADYINYGSMFNVNTINGTWGLNASVYSVSFDPISVSDFTITINTDNISELLYLNYLDTNGISRVIEIAQNIAGVLQDEGSLTFKIGSVTYDVSYSFDVATSQKTYIFMLSVSDADKIDATTYETISNTLIRSLVFFTIDNQDLVIEHDATSLENYVTTDLSGDINYYKSVSVTLTPQELKNITIYHYPNGELNVNTDNTSADYNKAEMYLQEVAYNNIIPGYNGVLKVNIIPYFTNFDYLTVTSTGVNTNIVTFEQMLAVYDSDLNFTGKYVAIYPFEEYITGGISLRKDSYKLDGTDTSVYDGMFYIRTLINSEQDESVDFTITITGYCTVDGVTTSQVLGTITLNVVVPPGLHLSYNGTKNNVVAVGTTVYFNVSTTGLEFGTPYFKDSVRVDGSEQSDTYFTIKAVTSTKYSLTIDPNKNIVGNVIRVIGRVSKQINDETYTYTDELVFKITNFVINSVKVNNVVNGDYSGVFNQSHDLTIKLDTTYNPNIDGLNIEDEILKLERYWSSVSDPADNNVWYYLNSLNESTFITNTGYNTKRTYIITRGGLQTEGYTGVIGYKLQNVSYNSDDILGARIQFVYTDTGVQPYSLNPTEEFVTNDNSSEFFYEETTEFGFGFYRLSTEDNPEPIRTGEELASMDPGVDYILLSDITLENWVPLNTAISSLDGNGYVITIKNFDLSTSATATSGTTLSGDVGLFSVVASGTTLKNITIEILPSSEVAIANENANVSESSLVDFVVGAQAYNNLNFGLVAGTNNGIITNTNVMYDASSIRLERELLLLEDEIDSSGISNLDYQQYYNSDNSINYDLFLYNNISTFFPRKLVTDSSNLWDEDNHTVYYSKISDSPSARRDLSIVKISPNADGTFGTYNIGGLVGKNAGYITNSSVEDVTINGVGYVAGLSAQNTGKISSSYFKGANIINRTSTTTNSATAGLVAFNYGSVQYSYVLGREGDGNNFQYAIDINYVEEEQVTTAVYTKSTNSDKTGLTISAKANFAGHIYNSYYNQLANYEYNYVYGALRAMNSAIISSGSVGGFVYSNSGTINNSYSNILLNSSTKTAGFVYTNNANSVISDVYSLSSVQINSTSHNPFTGTSNANVFLNSGTIKYSYYLKGSGTLTGLNGNADITYNDAFIDADEAGISINNSSFGDYNSFQGFAFNSDYSDNQEIERSVWFMGNGYELLESSESNRSVISQYFRDTVYIQNRPELVAANLKTLRVRKITSDEESATNIYKDVNGALGVDITNPIIIRTAEEFNAYVTEYVSANSTEQHNYIRFVSDITFNAFDIKARTYKIDYYGDLDGNGMTINQLRLVSDSEFEDINSVDKLGLFGSINSTEDKRGIVRNLNIIVSEVRGSNANYVGVLAGTIENASVYNINISGNETIQGKHVVGGLAGYIGGDSEIVNITVSNVGARASYFKTMNPFSVTNYTVLPQNMGNFELYNYVENGDSYIQNIDTISYVGGIAGILNVDDIDQENTDSTLRSARARRLTVTGSVNLVAEIVGGVFGGVGVTSTANDIDFIISGTPRLIGSRVVGGIAGDLRGTIDRATLRHSDSVQNSIDDSLKTAVSTVINNKFINSSSNYNSLFSGNPIFMGGLVGFNYNGVISNSYNKINVINLSAQYGGGIAGFTIGGTFENVYTTATVSAFKIVGGLVAVISQPNLVELNEYTSGEDTYYVTEYISGFNINNVPELRTLNIDASGFTNATSKTVFNSVAAINIWRSQDANNISRSTEYAGADNLIIGGIAGKLILTEQYGNYYYLSDVINIDGSLSASIRQFNDINYFNQVYLNSDFGTNSGNYYNLIQEFSYINNSTILYQESGVQTLLQRRVGENDIRFDGGTVSYYGINGTKSVDLLGGGTSEYYYSRMQNVASARTVYEFINRQFIASYASTMGDVNATNIAESVRKPKIYYNWPVNFWKGTELVSDGGLKDEEYVFPAISPVADLSEVEVWTADDLYLMGTYRKATYILMDDIDLSSYPEWESFGTNAKPFMGTILSNPYDNTTYTIYNLSITLGTNTYLGLVGYAKNAKFINFNLNVSGIEVANSESTSEYYIGSLYGYGDGVYIDGVSVNTSALLNSGDSLTSEFVGNRSFKISAYNVAAMGGLFGASFNTQINDISVSNVNLIVYSIYDNPTIYGSYVGGIAGRLEANAKSGADLTSITVSDFAVTDLNISMLQTSGFLTISDDYIGQDIAVGGLFGYVNSIANKHLVLENVLFDNTNFGNNIYFNAEFNSILTFADFRVSTGAIAGVSSAVYYDGIQVNNQSESVVSTLTLRAYNYIDNVYVGGAFGVFAGDGMYAGVYNLQNVEMANLNINYYQSNRITTENFKEIYLGGVVGKLSSVNVQNIFTTNINFTTLVSAPTASVSTLNYYVGGIAGSATQINEFSVAVVEFNFNKSSYPVNYANTTYVGGAFGYLRGYNGGLPGTVQQIATSGIIHVYTGGSFVSQRYVGGVAGYANNIYIDQAISNTQLYVRAYYLTSESVNTNRTTYVGGIVGLVNTEKTTRVSDGAVITEGAVSITNSYNTGDITYGGMLNGSSAIYDNYVGGIAGYAQVSGVEAGLNTKFTISNVYNIGKFVYISMNYRVNNDINENNQGGIIGHIDQQGVSNPEDSTNILISGAYYNGEIIYYGTKIGTALTTNQMLLTSSAQYSEFDDGAIGNVWTTITNNHYPMLTWANNIDASVQAAGTNVNPIIAPYSTLNGDSQHYDAYIITGSSGLTGNEDLGNVSLYYTSSSSDATAPRTTGYNTLIYNANMTDDMEENGGFIINARNLQIYSNNTGVVRNSNVISIGTNNLGLVDMVRYTSSPYYTIISTNEANSIVLNSIVSITVRSGFEDNSYYRSGTNFIYYINDTSYSYTSNAVDDIKNNATLLNTRFDFENVWVAFSSTSVTYNYGGPMLKWTFKDTILSNDVSDTYMWAVLRNGASYDSLYQYIDDSNTTTISIATANEFGNYAYMASVGSETTQTNVNVYGTDSVIINRVVGDSEISVVTTTYKYGVQTIHTRRVVDYTGKTLQLTNDIDLTGKLWTPIGLNYNAGTTYIDTVNSTAFKGMFDGNGYTITNLSVIVVNGNAGLFGNVLVTNTAGNEVMPSFVNGLTLKTGFVIATGDVASCAGSLAGRVYVATSTNLNYLINGFGNQNVNVVSNYIASGLVGTLNRNHSVVVNNYGPMIYQTYVNANIGADNSSTSSYVSAFAFDNIIDTSNYNKIALREVYYTGTLTNDNPNNIYIFVGNPGYNTAMTYITSSTQANSTRTSAYSTVSVIKMNPYVSVITTNQLKTLNLAYFDWNNDSATEPDNQYNGWYRLQTENNLYPIIHKQIQYWLDVYDSNLTLSGSGTIGDPYLIGSEEDLVWIAGEILRHSSIDFTNTYFVVIHEIDLAGRLWTPIGANSTYEFSGIFDGNSDYYSISNLMVYGSYTGTYSGVSGTFSDITHLSNDYAGLFGYVENSYIHDVTIQTGDLNSNQVSIVSGEYYVGGAIGYATNSVLTDIEYNGYVYGQSYVGGAVGRIADTVTLTYATASGVVVGNSYIGGITGSIANSTLSESVNSASVTGVGNYVGGITGNSAAVISNSENTGTIIGNNYVGGIAGNSSNELYAVQNSSTTSSVTGISYVGGIVGSTTGEVTFSNSTTKDLINNSDVYGTEYVGGIVGYASGASATITGVSNDGDIIIKNSMASPTIAYAGGVVGQLTNSASLYEAESSGYINQTYAYDTRTVGGIIGNRTSTAGIIKNVYHNNANSNAISITTTQSSTIGLLIGTFEGSANTNNFNMGVSNNYLSTISAVGNYGTLTTIKKAITNYSDNISTYWNHTSTNIVGDSFDELEAYTDSSLFTFAQTGYNTINFTFTYTYNISTLSGDGSSGNPYLIASLANFGKINDYYTRRLNDTPNYLYFRQTASLSISSGYDIGGVAFPFMGSYNGNSQLTTISSASLYSSSDYAGLFNYVYGTSSNRSILYNINLTLPGGTISRTAVSYIGGLVGKGIYTDFSSVKVRGNDVTHTTISAKAYLGGIAGFLNNSTLTNINTSQSLPGGDPTWLSANSMSLFIANSQSFVGGLVGYAGGTISITGSSTYNTQNYNTITNSNAHNAGGIVGAAGTITLNYVTNRANIKGTNNVGGIIGVALFSATLTNISNSENINGYGSYIGGLIGRGSQDTVISIDDSVNNNSVSSSGSYVGGIIGYGGGQGSELLTITYTHSLGSITGASYVGGIVGQHEGGAGSLSNLTIDPVDPTNTSIISIVATGGYVGGIAGYSARDISSATVSADYMNIRGDGDYIGGIVGYSTAGIDDSIIQSTEYEASIRGYDYVGGIVGYKTSGTISDSSLSSSDYVVVTGDEYVGGVAGYATNVYFDAISIGKIRVYSSSTITFNIGWNTSKTYGQLGMTDNWTDYDFGVQYEYDRDLLMGNNGGTQNIHFGTVAGFAVSCTTSNITISNSYIVNVGFIDYVLDLRKEGRLLRWELSYSIRERYYKNLSLQFGQDGILLTTANSNGYTDTYIVSEWLSDGGSTASDPQTYFFDRKPADPT